MNGAALWRLATLVVLALPGIVHVNGGFDVVAQTKQSSKKPAKDKALASADTLPRGVVEMVEAILGAVLSGRIADLADAVDWNEMKPDLGPSFVSDPIAYWKSISKDGDGRDILDVLGKLLADKPLVVPFGKDIENNRLFVWPAFADKPMSKLTPAELDAVRALTSPERLDAMRAADRYSGWRLVIGADGTWHSFRTD